MDPSDEGERCSEKRHEIFGFSNIHVVQQLVGIYQLVG
jgi:hypothetical protein